MLTAVFYVLPRIRMGGAMPLLHPHALMAMIETTLPVLVTRYALEEPAASSFSRWR
jgi:hypothetical protein